MTEIKTKAHSYQLYRSGALGNHLRVWDDWRDIYRDGCPGPITIRYTEPGSPFCKHNVPLSMLILEINDMLCSGADLAKMKFCEPIPDDKITFQGEYMHDPRLGGHVLFYHTGPGFFMREALRYAKHAYGLKAWTLIRHYFNASSFDDFEILREQYPTSVIEFTALSCNVGMVPHRNVMFWEVRNY